MTDEEKTKRLRAKFENASLSRNLLPSFTRVQEAKTPSTGLAISGATPPKSQLCCVCDEDSTDLAILRSGKSFAFHKRCLDIYGREKGQH
jgi:hypothetical protein